jgi:hypothetical protein
MTDNIYKVFIYDKDRNNYNIYVFVGNMELSKLQKIEQDFKRDPRQSQFIDIIFSENDYNYMKEDFSNVIFINESIYNSNTWEEISYKIANINNMYSYQELYLYGETNVDFDYDNIIDYLTHEGYVSKERLLYFLDNCNVDKGFEESVIGNEKTLFEYFDLKEMKLLEHINSIKQPLGIQFKPDHRFQYFHNPHKYEKDIFHYTSDFTPNLPLFHYLLSSTNIFCTPFHASFTNTSKKIVELYFPMLKDESISSETFTSIRKKLKEENIELENIFRSKDIMHYYFHSSYGSKQPKIENMKIILMPEKKMYISLETLFKILPTNDEKQVFLTKYNPGMKEEKLFKIATNKYKEPILRRVYLQKIQTEMTSAKKRYVGIYCEYKLNKHLYPMIIEIYETGHVQISLNNERLLDDKRFDNKGNKIELQDFENMLRDSYNEVIGYINQYYDHSGVSLPLFHTFFSQFVIVDNMKLIYNETIPDDMRIMKNLMQLDNELNSHFQIIEQTKQYTRFHVIPMFRLKNYKKMIATFELVDSKKRIYDLKVENVSNIGMIEYLQYSLFSLLKIAESPNKFIERIQSGVIKFPKKVADEIVEQEKRTEETEQGFILEDDKSDVEDLFDKQSQRSRTSSFASEKGFDFGNDDEDDDAFGNSDNSDDSFLGGERNFLQKRMEERDPHLFKSDKKEGLVYSRFCPSSAQRQPVSLTEDEMKNVDKSAFTKAIHYGSDSEHMNYYICPRYWCEEKNIPLRPDDVKMENGKLISEKCRKTDNSYAIITEFNNAKVHGNKEGNYEYTYPSVSKKSCIPCCFKKEQKNVFNQRCLSNNENDKSSDKSSEEKPKGEEIKEKTDEKNIKQKYNYIQQHNKFPLEPQKWGYLPLNIQAIMDSEGVKCEESFCMLRFGIKKDINSFLSALGSVLYIEQNNEELKLGNIPQYDTKDIRGKLIDAVDLDRFVSLQNGNLIQIFGKSIEHQKISDNIKKSICYQKMYKINRNLFNLMVDAYNNFKIFIKKSQSLDYFYLYDLICEPNEELFKEGVNIVILETENMDVTNNFNFICPTNFYKSSAFERTRKTILFMKHGNYYEPIYSNSTQNKIIHSFNFYNKFLHTLFVKFEALQNDRNNYCGVRSFDEMKYVYRENTLEYVVNILNKYGLEILNQVIYYNGRISGVTCKYNYKDKNHTTYIPCKLSNIVNYLPSIYISECEFHDFTTTYSNLKYIYNVTRNKIPCEPNEQVVDKKQVFGIKTIGNLLVPLKMPEKITNEELPHGENNYFVPYQNSMVHIDEMMIDKINEKTEIPVELESLYLNSSHYETFKTEIRSFLHKDKYKHISYEYKTLLLDYELDEREKIVRLKELFGKLYDIEKKKYNENLMMKLISEIVTNYRVQHYISVDDQYLFMNNHRSKKNEILISHKMLGDKDIYNDDELYKYVEYKENVYDYVLPVSKKLYDINEHLDNIKQFERISPLKKMSLKTNKSQFEAMSESIDRKNLAEKPKRCPKGTKWNKKMNQCVPK